MYRTYVYRVRMDALERCVHGCNFIVICSCNNDIPTIPGGHPASTGAVFCSCKNCIQAIPGSHVHDYRDVGGRATQDAKAEEQGLCTGRTYTACAWMRWSGVYMDVLHRYLLLQ